MNIIFTAVEEMQSYSLTIAESMHTLKTVNGKSTKAVDEIVSLAGAISAQVVEVAKSANTLSDRARCQQVLVSQFQLAK